MKHLGIVWALALVPWLAWSAPPEPAATPGPLVREGDVVALVGGTAWVEASESGTFETLLQLALPRARLKVRSLAREGDTVHERPREPNYPDLPAQLNEIGATLVLARFGAMESLDRAAGRSAEEFGRAYEALVDTLLRPGRRVVLVVPEPPESGREAFGPLAAVMRDLAVRRNLPLIDLSLPGRGAREEADGEERRQLEAVRLVSALGGGAAAERALEPGFWRRAEVVELRAAVVAKNRLWFQFSRPMNWAFLKGDRTEQLFSRDHRDPQVRAFLAEMEQFVPLLAEAETRVASLAAQGGAR